MLTGLLIATFISALVERKFSEGNQEVTMTNVLKAACPTVLKKASELIIGISAGFVAFQSL